MFSPNEQRKIYNKLATKNDLDFAKKLVSTILNLDKNDSNYRKNKFFFEGIFYLFLIIPCHIQNILESL